VLAEEEARDQEPADHEEDVDADEPAGDTGEPGMEQHDDQDSDSPQALDIGAKSVVVRSIGGCGHD
jgi:hypothetical protein